MVGAVAGTPGTLPTNWSFSGTGSTAEVVGTGVENGINYIDVKFSGTVTNTNLNFETSTAASASQTWAASSYFKLISGTFTGTWRLTINEFASGGAFLRTGLAQTFIATNASLFTQRVAGSFTTGASTASISVLINGQGAATPIDFTLRIGLPQLEQGAFATSVIPTTTAAATRAADISTSVATSVFESSWYRQDEGTFYGEATGVSGGATITVRASANAGERMQFANGPGQTAVISAAANQAIFGSPGTNKQAFAFKANDFAQKRVGFALETDSSGTVPVVNTATIGKFDFGGQDSLNGHIRRLVFWPVRAPNTTLESLTQ